MATSDVTITSTLLPTSAISATPSTDGLLTATSPITTDISTATSPITTDISTTSSSTTNGMLTITTGGYPEISTTSSATTNLITTGGYPEISTTLLTTNTTFPVTTSSLPANLTASTPHNNALAIGLGVGIPCGVLLLVAIAFLIYFLIKHKKPMSPHNTKTEEIPTTENQYETVMPRVRKPNDYVNISFDPYETAPDEPLYERTLNIN
ncbi:cell wall integrity and stress response component 2 isoform X10 [Xenopus tropicalis]|uniref:Cell wall integrity and stress response component 2 isoform X10 n=1 Tax=Xenopus tropicalis TaxID=8364 RepID=A0A8J1JVL5_XENTR|nr:cell wall integrity and stress response component 2 isoform X10 [Xenopus tropicalis]